MRKTCNKAENGKCLGGACPNHVNVLCHGGNNVRGRREIEPQYNPEDALIMGIDRGIDADEIAGMLFPAHAA